MRHILRATIRMPVLAFLPRWRWCRQWQSNRAGRVAPPAACRRVRAAPVCVKNPAPSRQRGPGRRAAPGRALPIEERVDAIAQPRPARRRRGQGRTVDGRGRWRSRFLRARVSLPAGACSLPTSRSRHPRSVTGVIPRSAAIALSRAPGRSTRFTASVRNTSSQRLLVCFFLFASIGGSFALYPPFSVNPGEAHLSPTPFPTPFPRRAPPRAYCLATSRNAVNTLRSRCSDPSPFS